MACARAVVPHSRRNVTLPRPAGGTRLRAQQAVAKPPQAPNRAADGPPNPYASSSRSGARLRRVDKFVPGTDDQVMVPGVRCCQEAQSVKGLFVDATLHLQLEHPIADEDHTNPVAGVVRVKGDHEVIVDEVDLPSAVQALGQRVRERLLEPVRGLWRWRPQADDGVLEVLPRHECRARPAGRRSGRRSRHC